MQFKLCFLILVTALLLSCSNENEFSPQNTDVIGFWVDGEYKSDTLIYQRSTTLQENQPCFAFEQNGKFTEQKNAGWCGTPPITYAIYEGTWQFKTDSTIQITVPYWGGISHYTWKILDINQQQLTYIITDSEYINNEN